MSYIAIGCLLWLACGGVGIALSVVPEGAPGPRVHIDVVTGFLLIAFLVFLGPFTLYPTLKLHFSKKETP